MESNIKNISIYFDCLKLRFLNSQDSYTSSDKEMNNSSKMRSFNNEIEVFFNCLKFAVDLMDDKNKKYREEFFCLLKKFQRVISIEVKFSILDSIINFLKIIEISDANDILCEQENLISLIFNYLKINTIFETDMIESLFDIKVFKRRIFKFYLKIFFILLLTSTSYSIDKFKDNIKTSEEIIFKKLFDLIKSLKNLKYKLFKTFSKIIFMQREYNSEEFINENIYMFLFNLIADDIGKQFIIYIYSEGNFLDVYNNLLILNLRVNYIHSYLSSKQILSSIKNNLKKHFKKLNIEDYLRLSIDENEIKILNKSFFIELICKFNLKNKDHCGRYSFNEYFMIKNLTIYPIIRYQCEMNNLKKLNFQQIYNLFSLTFDEIVYSIEEDRNYNYENDVIDKFDFMQISENKNFLESVIDNFLKLKKFSIYDNLIEKYETLIKLLKMFLEYENLKQFFNNFNEKFEENDLLDLTNLNLFMQMENYFFKNYETVSSQKFFSKVRPVIIKFILDSLIKDLINSTSCPNLIIKSDPTCQFIFLLNYADLINLDISFIFNILKLGYRKELNMLYLFYNNLVFNSPHGDNQNDNQNIKINKNSILHNLSINNLMILRYCDGLITSGNMNQVDHKEFTNLIFYSLNLLQLQIWGKLNSLSESSKSSSNLLILNYFCNNPTCKKRLKENKLIPCTNYMFICNNCNQEHMSIYYDNKNFNLIAISNQKDNTKLLENLNEFLINFLDFSNFNINYNSNRIHIYLRNIIIALNFFNTNYLSLLTNIAKNFIDNDLLNKYYCLINNWVINLNIVNFNFYMQNGINYEFSIKIKKYVEIIKQHGFIISNKLLKIYN